MSNLRIPGPIPVDAEILEAMGTPMINHRGPLYKEILYRTTESLKKVFATNNDLYIITGSGTAAMEAAVVNTLSPEDNVLNVTIGVFGNRFGLIAKRYGATVTTLEFPMGSIVDLNILRESLDKDPKIKAVLVTHNETSTGVTNNLESIANVVKNEYDKLLLVDGISSVCSIPIETDAWKLDVVTSASQKGWMLPPGLSFISLSQRAWDAHSQSTMPRFYLDMAEYKKYYEIGQPPWTPNISAMFALDIALKRIHSEGLGSIYERHADIAQFTRDSLKNIGMSIFPENENIASNTITAVSVPENIDGGKIVSRMRDEYDIEIAGGQGSLSGKILRIGHLGITPQSDIEEVVQALKEIMST